jgi:hypothetical protein
VSTYRLTYCSNVHAAPDLAAVAAALRAHTAPVAAAARAAGRPMGWGGWLPDDLAARLLARPRASRPMGSRTSPPPRS